MSNYYFNYLYYVSDTQLEEEKVCFELWSLIEIGYKSFLVIKHLFQHTRLGLTKYIIIYIFVVLCSKLYNRHNLFECVKIIIVVNYSYGFLSKWKHLFIYE